MNSIYNMIVKRLIKINDRLYCLPYRRFGDRPNIYYIKGNNYSIAIDAGNNREHVEYFYEQLRKNGLNLPKYTIISHWHWDHTFGLPYIVGKSICSSLTDKKLKEVKKWKWTLRDMRARELNGLDIKMCNDNILDQYKNLKDIKVVSCDIVINRKKTLDLGGIKVELIPKGSTHSDDSLFVYIKGEALFVMDADWIDPYVSYEYNQTELKKMIKFFESLDYKYHYLGHVNRETKRFAINRLKKEVKQ